MTYVNKPGKREYRIVKEKIRDYYEVEMREKEGLTWLSWGEWNKVYFPKNLDLAAATRLVESCVAEDREARENEKVVIKIWRD